MCVFKYAVNFALYIATINHAYTDYMFICTYFFVGDSSDKLIIESSLLDEQSSDD